MRLKRRGLIAMLGIGAAAKAPIAAPISGDLPTEEQRRQIAQELATRIELAQLKSKLTRRAAEYQAFIELERAELRKIYPSLP